VNEGDETDVGAGDELGESMFDDENENELEDNTEVLIEGVSVGTLVLSSLSCIRRWFPCEDDRPSDATSDGIPGIVPERPQNQSQS